MKPKIYTCLKCKFDYPIKSDVIAAYGDEAKRCPKCGMVMKQKRKKK
jgi:uncharacterized C2H2 Zn-finger protein